MHPVSPYPNTVLAAWQLALIAVVAVAGIAVWLGAIYYAARDPRPSADAAASHSPAQDAVGPLPAADALPAAGPVPAAGAGAGHRTAA
jgi:hypothetical protein